MDDSENDTIDKCHNALHDKFEKYVCAATGMAPGSFYISYESGVLNSREESVGRFEIHPHVGHTDQPGEQVHVWHKNKNLAFIGFMGLERRGMWIRLWPWYKGLPPDGATEGEAAKELGNDLFVFIPPMTVLLVPITMLHAGALRTSFSGNKRLHFYCYATKVEEETGRVAKRQRRTDPTSPTAFKNSYEKPVVKFPVPTHNGREKWARQKYSKTSFTAYPNKDEPGSGNWSPWTSPTMASMAEHFLLF